MNRMLILGLGLLGAAMPLVMDSALKGAALLGLAALAALLLWRASAAARHMVWLVAVVVLLLVPLLSALLPGWRVLPQWAVAPNVKVTVPAGALENRPYEAHGAHAFEHPTSPEPDVLSTSPPDLPPLLETAPAPLELAQAISTAPVSGSWRTVLPGFWLVGCGLLLLRLLGAHWMLRKSSRGCSEAPVGLLTESLASCARHLGVRQRVRLLLDQKRTIPVVWGVWRPRLILPAEALAWDDGQLQSVFLHELAHIRRRDTLVQWITQLACAFHWFNPLVWLAAWRLHVERERACDDRVLASGVKASAYASHLLHVASQLDPARWTSVCGLAMARKSSLEGRLLAVLSDKLNRRGVTTALAAIALLLGAGIAIPVAMLRAEDDKWDPPRVAHIGGNDFSSYCVHDGKDTSFVIAYHGDFDSSTESSSNAKSRTWTDSGTITAKKSGIALSFHRTQAAPGTLSIATAPAEARDLSKPAPAPRDFGQKEYDLAKGRVFLLTDSGVVRQLDLPTPLVTDQASSMKLAALIANIQPQQGDNIPMKPNQKDARELYEIWQRHERANGDIPGALIGELAAAVKVFIGYNPTYETVPQLNALLPRLDATHDWKSADAIALLDEVAAIKDSPLSMAMRRGTRHTIRNGEALPEKFADAPWGDIQPNGLRAACVLEPGAAEHRIGAALKARLLVQNSGQVPIMLQVPTWYQGGVKATDAKGAEVEVSGIEWTTMAQLVPVRLGTGESIEIYTPGIGFGPRAGMGPWAGPRVGSNVLAKAGGELTLTHSPVPLDGSEVGMSEDGPHVIGPDWWQAHIKTRLARELPLPADAAERTHLLDRAVRELFATAPTAEETAAFIADQTPGALDALIKRLAAREDVVSFSGKLPTAPAKFRVLAADANADKQPRVVLGPGEYPLPSASARRGDATLKIVGRPVGDRRTNDAQLIFEATEFTGARPPDPHKLEVPDGWGTWAIVCRPSDGFFYLLHKGAVRKIDCSAPRNVTDTPANDLPAEFRDEVKRQLEVAGVSVENQAEIFEQPAPPATTPAPKTGASIPASDEAPLKPKHEYAQSLFRKWQANARTDGKISGALIGHVAREIDHFVKRYPQDEKAPQLAALRPRLDASRDWTQAEVVALLDDITAISTAPVSWAATPMESSEAWTVRAGEPLPIELKSAAWGSPAKNGLRAAWLLEPRAEQYPLGTVLKARVLFHNTGTKPVVFKTETWHQDDPHTARDADGQAIPVGDTFYTGETPMATYRLEPGEYVAFRGHGIGIGAGEYREERSTGSIGAWIEAKERDEVSFSSQVDASREGWTGLDDPKDPMELWKLVVRQRVEREAPLPSIAADREQLIHRVTRDLFGEPPTAEEIAAFTTDAAPDALAKLTLRLQARQRIEPFVGKLPTGEIKFRVIAVDPNAAKAPRTANAPGRYVLGDNVHLLVSQLTEGDKPRTNKARIAFLSPDPKVASPHKPYEIALPDGIGTYGIVWDRGAGVLWVVQKDLVRKYDFANPAQVQEMKIEPGTIINIPAHMQEALKQAFDLSGESVPQQKEKPTAAAAPKLPKLPDDAYARPGVHCQSFREEDAKRPGGELMEGAKESSLPEDRDKELILGLRTAGDAQWRIGGTAKVGLVVRNQSKSDVKFAFSDMLDSGLSIVAIDEAGKEHKADVARTPLGFVKRQQMLLPPGHVATVREFILRFDAEKLDAGDSHIAAFYLPAGKYKLRCKWSDANPTGAHEGEWTGELVGGEHKFTLAAAAPASETPKTPAAGDQAPKQGAKLKPATEQNLKWGDPVNGLRAALIMHPVPDEPDAGDKNDIFLVVQNVTKAEVWLHASDAAPNPRQLIWREKGILETINEVAKPIPADFRLQPGEVAFFRMTHPPAKPGGRNEGSVIAASIHHDPTFDLTGKMEIEKAPAGAWTGKLLSGEIKGGTAIPGFSPAENQGPAADAGAPPKKGDNVVLGAEKPKGAQAKITPDALLGFWRGTVNGEKLTLSFHRPPVEKDVQLDIYFGEATIGALATFTIAADGGSAAVVQQSAGGGMQFGTLIPVGEGKLKLELFGRQKGQMELVLTRDADAPATEPRQKEPRDLFEMWKTTANADGTIPGTFIGALATEVRAYVKAHPNLDSGMQLPKLLPRFVTSRDWTQAEAIKLLDDLAYYSTAPIAARVAKCKLPSGPLWRSEVEFQDIPVQIEKWSEAKDGLRIGMRVVGADWRVGGKARVELWLHNAGGKDVTFKCTGPDAQVAGVAVFAIDAEGHEHPALTMMKGVSALPMNCTLLAEHVAMAKKFEVTFVDAEKQWNPPGIQNLKPGKYQLRCKWMDAHPTISQPGDWAGELTAPDMEFTLAAKGAAEAETLRAEKPKPEAPKGAAAKLPDSAYPKVGIPLGELDKRVEWSGVDTQGLRLGIHIQDNAVWRVGGEVKAEVWVRNAGETDEKFSHSPRADVGLSIIAKGADGKEHFADITQFRGKPAYTHMLLPAGNVVKLKEFTIKLGVKNEGERVNLDLPLGDYKLRAKLTDTTSHVVPEGEWTGDLTTGDADFKLAAAHERDDHTYSGVGFPVDAFKFAMPPWGEVKDGLRTGIRIMGEARIGGRVQVELWIQNTSTKSVRFRESGDVDRGLAVIAEDSDGKIHPATLSSIRSYVPSRPYRLPPGYILKAKEFTLFLDSEANAHPRGLSANLHLPEGTYKLHTIWGGAKAKDVPEIEWKGEIESGEAELKIAPANAGADTTPAAKGEVDVKLVAADAPKTAGTKEEALRPDTAPAFLASGVMPKLTHLFNDNYAAIAVQSEKDVNFVLIYEGAISSGITESSSEASGKWGLEGSVHLVDREKTKTAGKNVDKRIIALEYSSDAPTLLFLDGKAYDLNAPWLTTGMGRISPPGRMFILRDEGDTIQTNRTLALRDEKDFETISHFAVSDRFCAEHYAESRRVQKMEGWVLGWDSQNSIQYGDGERVVQMRIFPDGRVLSLSQGQEWKDFKIPPEELAALLRWLSEDARIGEWNPEKVKTPDGLEFERDPVKNMWDRDTDLLFFKLDGKRHGIVAESGGSDAEAFNAIRERLKEMSKGVTAIVQKPEAKWVTVELRKEGTVFLERNAVTIDELKSAATQHPEWRIGVEADVEVAYAKVLELADALRSINVEFGYKDGRMGDGKVHIANFQANYAFDDNHRFSICRPSSWPQFFTIGWPTKDGRSARRLRFYPEMSEQTRGKWAVAWEPGTDVLWWVDEAHVGKMTLTDPDRLVVEREGRMDRFSTGFGFPEAVQIEFRRLGLVVGQIGQIGGDADGNPSSREVLTAETVDEKGVGMSERPTVHPHDEFTDEWMSLAQEVADARGLESREMDALIAWGEENDGIRSGMLMMNRAKVGEQLKTRVVIRNVSPETKNLKLSPVLNRMDAMARTPEGKQLTVRKVVLFGTDPVFSYTLKPGEQLEFPGPPIQFGLEHDTDGNIKTPEWPVCGVEAGPGSLHLKMSLINVRAPDTGEIEMDIANR